MGQTVNKNVLVLTYWDFDDPLIQTYTLPYVRMIKAHCMNGEIHLVTLDRSKKSFPEDGLHHVSIRYYSFGIKATWQWIKMILSLCLTIRRKKISIIHTWCTPAGGLGAVLSRLTGRKLIIDSFEPHAEPMVESGTWKRSDLAFKILFWLEKLQAKTADAAIACVASMKQYSLEKYGAVPKNFYWKPACVDFTNFDLSRRGNLKLAIQLGLNDKVVCVYAGKFGGSYLGEEVFHFLKIAHEHFGKDFRFLLLNNQPDSLIKSYCEQANFDFSLIVKTYVKPDQIPDYIGIGNFGLVPFKPVPSKKFGSPIKTGEYMAMGLPIIITKDISDDSQMIKDLEVGVVLENLCSEEYLRACQNIELLLGQPTTPSRVRKLCVHYKNLNLAENVYKELYH